MILGPRIFGYSVEKSTRMWTLNCLSAQVQVFGNVLIWQTNDDEGGKAEKDGFPCYSQADCLSDECCIVSGDDADQQGACKKLGTIGSSRGPPFFLN